MAFEESLNSFLKEWLTNNAGNAHVVGKAVNVTDQKCDIEREGAPTIHDVLFCAIEDTADTRIVIKPKEGSYVLVGFIEATHEGKEGDAFLEQCSEIDEVFVKTGNKIYKLNSQGHLLKGGGDTLKELIQLLIDAIKLTIEATQQIVVVYGNNPDYSKLIQANLTKLVQATNKLNNILQ
jgi:hypothetical protein